MARTTRFREQHSDLLKVAAELDGLLVESQLAQDATNARRCLSGLLGKLVVHIGTEDKVLYPELRAHKDAAVATLATRFAKEMEGTANAVKAYSDKWPAPSAIRQNPKAFIADTKGVLRVLADRIRRENSELYAAADRLEGVEFA